MSRQVLPPGLIPINYSQSPLPNAPQNSLQQSSASFQSSSSLQLAPKISPTASVPLYAQPNYTPGTSSPYVSMSNIPNNNNNAFQSMGQLNVNQPQTPIVQQFQSQPNINRNPNAPSVNDYSAFSNLSPVSSPTNPRNINNNNQITLEKLEQLSAGSNSADESFEVVHKRYSSRIEWGSLLESAGLIDNNEEKKEEVVVEVKNNNNNNSPHGAPPPVNRQGEYLQAKQQILEMRPVTAAPSLPSMSHLNETEILVTKGLQYCQWGKQEELANNLPSSLRLYREGLDMLRDAYIQLSFSPGNESKLEFLQSIIGYHISRAEEIRMLVHPQSSMNSMSSINSMSYQSEAFGSNKSVNTSSTNINNLNKSTNSNSGANPLTKGASFVASKLTKAESLISDARRLDTNGLLDEAIFRYHATQQELQMIAEDPVFIEQRKQISGKLLIVEQRLIKLLRYRKQVMKALPHPYRLIYDVPERLITKTGIGQAIQATFENVVETHLIEDDPYYQKYKLELMEKEEKKEEKEKDKKDKKKDKK